ncbi:peptide-methionine (S)-S-oxide reductase MsrA [Candidatus Haliotispira prima]|uniref:Peptide methionine sulfoxide reductase MsrA n=1 Tax=Candidatus Haliotispira prima TaxID=3034016 RepID=A0ABY8MMP2_9SPIO|nr:peptide-methionine (S)-S-oxide reductase MsrA [Candidatus Haliotispira prima]
MEALADPEKGYTDYAPLFAENPQESARGNPLFATAVFAGGCFWCTESAFEGLEGVMKVLSGYTGGDSANPSYEEVSGDGTGHYEAIIILYRPEAISYRTLLDIFWRQIDPTDGDGQFYDRGTQYRTAVFYRNEEERVLAEESKARLRSGRAFGDKEIVTEILAEEPFYLAEDYHQDYFAKNPQRYQRYVKGSGRKYFLQSIWNDRPRTSEKP